MTFLHIYLPAEVHLKQKWARTSKARVKKGNPQEKEGMKPNVWVLYMERQKKRD